MLSKVLSKSTEQSFNEGTDALNGFKKLTGEIASVCYSSSFDVDDLIMSKESAESLCDKVLSKGHTSVAEHFNVSIAFQGISKLMAMMLNSFQVYSTSERSGRYTLMTGNTQREVELYIKWLDTFKELIKQDSPEILDTVLITRARENARYVLSVLTHSISMVYTTNVRQWNTICKVLERYSSYISANMPDDEFYTAVREDIEDLVHNIRVQVGYSDFKDDSLFGQDMFCCLSDNNIMKDAELSDSFGVSYTTKYKASYAQLAQVHRHRAIKYFITSNLRTNEFYVPQILRGTEYEDEWLADLGSVAHLVPQATLLSVIEVGYLGDFLHKCDERICGRAMLETMEQTVSTLNKYRDERANLPSGAETALCDRFKADEEPKLKCDVRGICHEPCNKLGINGTPLKRKV